MKTKILCLIFAAAFAFSIPIAAAGCGKDDKVIRINEVTHSVFYTPLYLADALGYFADEGYSIELTNGGGADATMAALLSGSADVAFCGPEAALYVVVGGSSDAPKVFGQLTKRDGSFLVGRDDEPDFDWHMLEGKNILAGRKGGIPAMTFEYTLHKLGVSATLNYDVAFNMMTSAFESGVSDYCTMFEPVASDFEAAGKGHVVASVGEQSGEVPYTCFAAKSSFLEKNSQKADALLRAVTKAIKYTMENDDTLIAQKIAPYFDGTPVSSLALSVKNYKAIDAWVTDMAMKESALDNLQDIMDFAGELERRVKFDELVVTDRAHAIYREVYGV